MTLLCNQSQINQITNCALPNCALQTVQMYIDEHNVSYRRAHCLVSRSTISQVCRKYFPWKILKIEKKSAVTSMAAFGCEWKCPKKEDVFFYKYNKVIFHTETTENTKK